MKPLKMDTPLVVYDTNTRLDTVKGLLYSQLPSHQEVETQYGMVSATDDITSSVIACHPLQATP